MGCQAANRQACTTHHLTAFNGDTGFGPAFPAWHRRHGCAIAAASQAASPTAVAQPQPPTAPAAAQVCSVRCAVPPGCACKQPCSAMFYTHADMPGCLLMPSCVLPLGMQPQPAAALAASPPQPAPALAAPQVCASCWHKMQALHGVMPETWQAWHVHTRCLVAHPLWPLWFACSPSPPPPSPSPPPPRWKQAAVL